MKMMKTVWGFLGEPSREAAASGTGAWSLELELELDWNW